MRDAFTGFSRRENPDHTIDLICRRCFRTVVTTKSLEVLDDAEREHSCDARVDSVTHQDECLHGTL